MNPTLTLEVKRLALSLGADLVGIANVERWTHAPHRLSPSWILPTARSVVVCAAHHPDACVELGGEPEPQEIGPYKVTDVLSQRLTWISFAVARFLDDLGYPSIPLDITDKGLYKPYRFQGFEEFKVPFLSDMCHIYAAVAAGLAQLGWNGLALTPERGPRNRFISIVTDAILDPTPLYTGSPVCDRCGACVDHCPTGALSIPDAAVLKIEDREYTRAAKDLWKCCWAEHFMLDLNLPIPEVITEDVLLEHIRKHGLRVNAIAPCFRFCLPPKLREDDPHYSRVHRRKTSRAPGPIEPSRALLDRAAITAADNALDVVGVISKGDAAAHGVPLTDYLPGAESAILLKAVFPLPSGEASREMLTRGVVTWLQSLKPLNQYEQVAQLHLDFAALRIARDMENAGYASIVKTDVDLGKLARVIGGETPGEPKTATVYEAVLTDAPMQTTHVPVSYRGIYGRAGSLSQFLRDESRRMGADLIGVSSARRIDAVLQQLRGIKEGESRFIAHDRAIRFMPYEPEIQETSRHLYSPFDYLPNATSVLVLGLGFPTTVTERAKTGVAGPYVFMQQQLTTMLGSLAYRVVKLLAHLGYNAAYTYDLLHLGSEITSPAGMLPNATCNAIEAACAGLGAVAWNGTLVTPQYGQNQRLVAIVTDAPLDTDAVRDGSRVAEACLRCGRCLGCCPARAIREEQKVAIRADGVECTYIPIDSVRCDWSSKYALCAADGIKYVGSLTNVLPPELITCEALADALRQTDPISKHRQYTVEGCIVECPLANGGADVSALFA
jgi:epoxyqueuosine reductase QueG